MPLGKSISRKNREAGLHPILHPSKSKYQPSITRNVFASGDQAKCELQVQGHKNENSCDPESLKNRCHSISKSPEYSLISGARVFVRLDVRHPNALWYQADLVSPVPGNDNSFLVDAYCFITDDGHIESSDDTTRFTVSRPNIAFSEPPKRIIPVSSHVIASQTSGIIAEKPCPDNGHKYLIFFENGIAEYFDQSEVFQVSQGRYDFYNINTVIPDHYRVWLQDYFERYPKRLRPKYLKNEYICYNTGSYEYPMWQKAQVIRAKNTESLIHISIESHLHRGKFDTLRVYRASPKLFKIHQLVSEFIKKNGESFKPLSMMDTINTDQLSHSNSNLRTHLSPVKNSNYTLSIRRLKPSLRPRKSCFDNKIQNTLALPVKGDKSFALSRAPPSKLHPPNQFQRHSCSSLCLTRKVDLRTLRGLNPFFFPIYLGFRKSKDSPHYVAPCGTILASLNEIEEYLILTDCVLDVDHFTLEPIEIFNDKAHAPHPCFTYVPDITGGLEFQPISLINFIDDQTLDTKYTYVADRIFDQHTKIPMYIKSVDDESIEQPDPFLPCCQCTDNCSNPETCACIHSSINDEFKQKLKGFELDDLGTDRYSSKRLIEASKFGIYECNRQCACNKFCPNRVVQNGIKCVLQIFMTAEKGWGVRTLYDIPAGTFVSTYAAKVMCDESVNELDVYTANLDFIECAEAHKEGYEESCRMSPSDELELFDLESGYSSSSPKSESQATVNHPPNCYNYRNSNYAEPLPHKRKFRGEDNSSKSSGRKSRVFKSVRDFFPDKDPYVLDAQIFGNIGRFYNHSCDPNMFIQNVFIDTHDLRLPHVAFFTNRFVNAFDELTWDYSYEIDSVPNRQIACKCGTDECRGRLL